MSTHQYEFQALPEQTRIDFYGILFALAAADESIDKEEMDLIYESLDLDGFSESGKRTVYGYILEPPVLGANLSRLGRANEAIRYGLLLNLTEIAIADDEIGAAEQEMLETVRTQLKITREQSREIETYAREVKRIRERGLDDNTAADALKRAGSGLAAVGVPITAIYFSGSVVGLSAAGITSGLAALGLGIGMIPGIGVAILLGAGIYYGISRLTDAGGKRKKERRQAEQERKAQLVIKNLQETINALSMRVSELLLSAADAQANREALEVLTQRLRKLQQILNRRKSQLEPSV